MMVHGNNQEKVKKGNEQSSRKIQICKKIFK